MAATRTLWSVSRSATTSGSTARASPIAPRAVAAASRAFLSLSRNAAIRGSIAVAPILTRTLAAASRTPALSSRSAASSGSRAGTPRIVARALSTGSRIDKSARKAASSGPIARASPIASKGRDGSFADSPITVPQRRNAAARPPARRRSLQGPRWQPRGLSSHYLAAPSREAARPRARRRFAQSLGGSCADVARPQRRKQRVDRAGVPDPSKCASSCLTNALISISQYRKQRLGSCNSDPRESPGGHSAEPLIGIPHCRNQRLDSRGANPHENLGGSCAGVRSLPRNAAIRRSIAGAPILTRTSAAASRNPQSLSRNAITSGTIARASPMAPRAVAAALRTSQSRSRNATTSGTIARASPMAPRAVAAALRTSQSLSRNATTSGPIARASPIAPRAAMAASRAFRSLPRNATTSGSIAGTPILTRTSTAASRTTPYSSRSAASSGSTARAPPIAPRAAMTALRIPQLLSRSAACSGSTARASPICPRASAALRGPAYPRPAAPEQVRRRCVRDKSPSDQRNLGGHSGLLRFEPAHRRDYHERRSFRLHEKKACSGERAGLKTDSREQEGWPRVAVRRPRQAASSCRCTLS